MNKRLRLVLLVSVLLLVPVLLSGCGVPQGQLDLNKPSGFWQTIVFLLAQVLIAINDFIKGIGIPYSWGWAIILFTIAIKVITLPLTLKQLQSAKATQELQPKLAELQQKYGKDRQKLSEEQMKLYKEAGVNPMGGCLPLLIQMPILFALYQSLYVLANPSIGKLQGAGFFWIPDLAIPSLTDTKFGGVDFKSMNWLGGTLNSGQYGLFIAYISLPVIMLASQIILQKMSQPAASSNAKQDDQARMMNQMMLFMPLMFGYITLGLPAGLTLYWSVSNILSLIQQYFITGWGSLGNWIPALKPRTASPAPVMTAATEKPGTTADVERAKQRRRRKK